MTANLLAVAQSEDLPQWSDKAVNYQDSYEPVLNSLTESAWFNVQDQWKSVTTPNLPQTMLLLTALDLKINYICTMHAYRQITHNICIAACSVCVCHEASRRNIPNVLCCSFIIVYTLGLSMLNCGVVNVYLWVIAIC